MAVSNVTVGALYNANGVSDTFAIPFTFILGESAAVTKVYEISATTGLIVQTYTGGGVDYDLDPAEDVPTQVYPTNVVFDTAPANGKKILVTRELPLTQNVSPLNNGGFLATDLAKGIDRLAMQVQQLDERVDRSFLLNRLDSGFTMDIPPSTGKAGQFLILNEDEDALEWSDVDAGALQTAIDAAAASAAAAAASAAAAATAETNAETAETNAETAETNAEAAQAAAEAAQAAAEAAATSLAQVVTGTRLSPVALASAGTLTPAGARREKVYVVGNGGAVTNVSIGDGSADGDELTVVFCSDTNTVEIKHGNNTKQNGDIVGQADTIIRYSWDLADWTEISRSM